MYMQQIYSVALSMLHNFKQNAPRFRLFYFQTFWNVAKKIVVVISFPRQLLPLLCSLLSAFDSNIRAF